jgi:leader peptidase (prepilin peptidase)/N-methyltransferase
MTLLLAGSAFAAAGAIAGSFLAVILLRWPAGRSAAAGRSRCDSCDRALSVVDLVPIASFVVLGGRCRSCRARIDPRHLAIELAAVMIALTALAAHDFPLAFATALFGWWLLLLAALDAEHQWLPDRLTWPLMVAGIGIAAFGIGPDVRDRLIGGVLGFGALGALAAAYRRLRGREGLGGGDPKLFGAIGAWIGWQHLPFVLLGAGCIGLAGLLLMRLRGQPIHNGLKLPLGTFLALAAWPAWLVIAA